MENQVGENPSSKGLLIAVASLLSAALALAFFCLGPHVQVVAWLIHKLYLLVVAAIVLAAATAVGARLLDILRLRPDALSARITFGAGAGLGLLSLVTLLLGLLGLLHQVLFLLLIGAGALLCRGTLLSLSAEAFHRLQQNWKESSAYAKFLYAAIAVVLCMNLLGAFTPPWQYDDLEYHLGVPAQFYKAGRITYLENNVYSNFPANVEMWHLAGMILTQSTPSGAYVGKLLNLAVGILTAVALWSLANGMFGKPAGAFAAAFFYVSPAVVVLSCLAHVEIALTFYIVLSIYGFILHRDTAQVKWLVLSAISCGLALGCKYTAAMFLLLPLIAGAFVSALSEKRGMRVAAKRAAIVLGISLALVSPWLLKNLVNTGNPVYPLLWSVLGGDKWDAARETMWREAHFVQGLSPAAWAGSARYFFMDSEIMVSILAFVFIPFLILQGRGRAGSIYLIVYFLLCYVFWFCFSHRDARFLMPSASVLPVLSAGGFVTIQRRIGRMLLAPLLLLCLAEADLKATRAGNFDAIFCFGADEQFFKDNTDLTAVYQACMFLNSENVPPDANVLFIGEARTFYCNRDFIAPTVFDRNVFEDVLSESKTPDEAVAALRGLGVTHLLVNWIEIRRLNRTCKGAFDRFDMAKFEALRKVHLAELFTSQCPGSQIAIYQVLPPAH